MRSIVKRALIFTAAVAAVPLLAIPVDAQEGGVSVTIRKGPSYLNTRTVARPATSSASYDTNAQYQPVFQSRHSISFSRSPLPSTFDVPGY